jgi:hypothetical protein
MQIFARTETDASGSVVKVFAKCWEPAQLGETSCTVKLVLKVNGATYLDKVETVPVGDAGVEEDIDTSKARDAALAKGGKLAQVIEVRSADGATLITTNKRTDAVGAWTKGRSWVCGFPAVMKSTGGGAVSTSWGSSLKWKMTGAVPVYLPFVVGKDAISVSFHGLTYKFAPGTRARFDCVGFLTSVGQVLVPTAIVMSGSVEAAGQPAKQIASALVTPEGTFRSLNREKVDFTVSRASSTRISTMRVTRGKTLQVSHVSGSGANFPCTSGKSISVGRHGIIKHL